MSNSDYTEDDRKALEALVVDNSDLDELEALLDQFNIFEALGAVKVELRHSDFLAFLLNPDQNHGLGDAFVKGLLQKALFYVPDEALPVTPIDLDVWDLDELLVLREWQNIDILLVDELHQFVVIIENKVVSGEHGDQLKRYHRIVKDHYPECRILTLFLTPEGQEPSDPNYIPIDYTLIAELVERLTETRASTLGPDVRTLMTHYSQMLRRHIVSESEIARLCQRIYRKHQRAMDMILEYRPDRQEEIRKVLEIIIQENPDFNLDICSKSRIRFAPKEWDTQALQQGQGWTRLGRILMFEYTNSPSRLNLNLTIGPGPEDIRQKLFDTAHAHKPPFKPAYKALGKSYNTIFQKRILTAKSIEESSIDELEEEIRKKWDQLLNNDLPKINDIFRSQDWIWE